MDSNDCASSFSERSCQVEFNQAFFLYETEKLSSRFSITQMPKILKNTVFTQKLSSKPPKDRVILKNLTKKLLEKIQFLIVSALKNINF